MNRHCVVVLTVKGRAVLNVPQPLFDAGYVVVGWVRVR